MWENNGFTFINHISKFVKKNSQIDHHIFWLLKNNTEKKHEIGSG